MLYLQVPNGGEFAHEIPRQWEKHDDFILFPASAFATESVWFDPDAAGSTLRKELGGEIIRALKVKRLAKKTGAISNDEFRSPKVRMIFASSDSELNDFWVRRRENGIIYTWDCGRSMFSVGNITEKLRLARMDCSGEIIVDLFAGIGYFALPYLVKAKARFLHACEWNPAAVEALEKNLRLNKVDPGRYAIHPGDNRVNCPAGIADRVNLGLIPDAKISYGE